MRRIFLLILTFAFVYNTHAQQDVTFSVQADADDWQLFMSSKLINDDLIPGGKVVFITLTAGDEGNGTNAFNGSAIAYYLAKERGSVYSTKFISDYTNFANFPNAAPLPVAQNVVINGKSMVKYVYLNMVNYFLRLPDGGSTGSGYSGTGNNSLMKLKQGTITSLTSVTGSATYTWTELLNTIYSIILTEKGADPQVWLNTSNLNIVVNPNDHSDHIFSSTAAQEAVATRLWVGINEFVMEHSSNLSANLNNEDYEDACAAFNMYNWSLIKDKYPSKLNSTTRAWLPMEYFSINRSPVGNGPLPVTLLSFYGTLKGNNVLLDWITSSEFNSKEFQIEKSNDGITYRKLSTIPAAGNSTTLKKYSYLDTEATELNYYQLKIVDIDESNKQSNVVIVKNGKLSQGISAVNNPFKDYINIRFAKIPKGTLTLKLVDLSGRLISTSQIYNPLSSIIRLDYNKALSKGIYILHAESEGEKYSIKLMKE
jgi:GH24 family phage-related lysozyme (muramidase)